MKKLMKHYYAFGAAMTAGTMLLASDANAANNFGKISENVAKSVENVPGLLTALAYLFGILLGVLGIMKIKDHVENPSQTHLKDGAIRLAAGGALFALPIVYEAMFETTGSGSQVALKPLKAAKFTPPN